MVAPWQFGLVGILVVATVTDLQTRKIYNWLTFPAMAVGLALMVAINGLPGLQSSLIGFFVAATVFVIGFLLPVAATQMGAGDVKLMAAIGLWLGWPAIVAALLYTTLLGGVVALVVALRYGVLVQMFKNIYWFFLSVVVPGGKAHLATVSAPGVPYGVSIALGTLLALFFPEPNTLLQLLRVT